MKELYMVNVNCLFCSTPMVKEDVDNAGDNDLIACRNCGRENLKSSLINSTLEKGKEVILEDIQNKINKMFKK